MGLSALAKKVAYLDKFSVITNAGLLRLDKFWPKRTNLQTRRRRNLSRAKNRQNKQNASVICHAAVSNSISREL